MRLLKINLLATVEALKMDEKILSIKTWVNFAADTEDYQPSVRISPEYAFLENPAIPPDNNNASYPNFSFIPTFQLKTLAYA